MDTSTSAAPDEKTPPTQLNNEKSKPSGPLEIGAERFSSVARLTSSSINELQGLVSELQKMQDFLKSEVDNVQRQIDSALAGIKYHRRNYWAVEKPRRLTNTSIRHSQWPRGGTGGQC